MRIAWAVYLVGVAIGLWRTDGGLAMRLALALLWPLGPLVFCLVIVILLASSLIAFPAVAGVAAAAAALAWWWLR